MGIYSLFNRRGSTCIAQNYFKHNDLLNYAIEKKSKKNKKHLLYLEELFDSGIIGVKEYLKSASFMVGKMPGETYGGDEVSDDINLITDQNEKDWMIIKFKTSCSFIICIKIIFLSLEIKRD